MSKFNFAVVPAVAALSLVAAFSAHAQNVNDPADQAGYGAMPAAGVSLRTRAEVRAEAIAARDAGAEAGWREGGDPQYAIVTRARSTEAARMLAGAAAKAAQ